MLQWYKCGAAYNYKKTTFANGEVKEVREVKGVKAICFTAKSSPKEAVGFNF